MFRSRKKLWRKENILKDKWIMTFGYNNGVLGTKQCTQSPKGQVFLKIRLLKHLELIRQSTFAWELGRISNALSLIPWIKDDLQCKLGLPMQCQSRVERMNDLISNPWGCISKINFATRWRYKDFFLLSHRAKQFQSCFGTKGKFTLSQKSGSGKSKNLKLAYKGA